MQNSSFFNAKLIIFNIKFIIFDTNLTLQQLVDDDIPVGKNRSLRKILHI